MSTEPSDRFGWRTCQKCNDYHYRIVSFNGALRVQCKRCGNLWVLICPQCKNEVVRVERWTNAGGMRHISAVCCRTMRSEWNVATKVRAPMRADALLLLGNECAKCGKTAGLEVDHIIPLCQGGPDILDNMQILCRLCHDRKTVADIGARAARMVRG